MLEDQLIQNGVIFNNILLIWRDKFFEDAYFGSDFMLIGITDPKPAWNLSDDHDPQK